MTTTTTAPEYTAPPGFTLQDDGHYSGPSGEGDGWTFQTTWAPSGNTY